MSEKIEAVNPQVSGTVFRDLDDWNYQVLALYLLHGYGVADNYFFPWQTHNLSKLAPAVIEEERFFFFRAPGFPIHFSTIFASFGYKILISRYMLVLTAWLTTL